MPVALRRITSVITTWKRVVRWNTETWLLSKTRIVWPHSWVVSIICMTTVLSPPWTYVRTVPLNWVWIINGASSLPLPPLGCWMRRLSWKTWIGWASWNYVRVMVWPVTKMLSRLITRWLWWARTVWLPSMEILPLPMALHVTRTRTCVGRWKRHSMWVWTLVSSMAALRWPPIGILPRLRICCINTRFRFLRSYIRNYWRTWERWPTPAWNWL